jgi:hypothetical protein
VASGDSGSGNNNTGNQTGVVAAASIGGPGSTGGTSLPLWLPIILSIPAVAVIWLGLRKWRLAEVE